MPKIPYVKKRFEPETMEVIEQANAIIEDYAKQRLDLTLRQLFYQFVSKNWIANTEKSYSRLGDIISDGRLAGMIDWSVIKDRGRKKEGNTHWDSEADLIQACSEQFRINTWQNQKYRCEVWIEKDALSGVLAACCPELDVPYFACKGYVSQSSMWEAAMRIVKTLQGGDEDDGAEKMYVFHLGDHDPSGIDMTRDIQERLSLLSHDADIEVKRIALNMDQVRRYNPPPNPAKMSDARASGYVEKYGTSSWELDALEPNILIKLVQKHVLQIRNHQKWSEYVEKQNQSREDLGLVAKHWTVAHAAVEEHDEQEE